MGVEWATLQPEQIGDIYCTEMRKDITLVSLLMDSIRAGEFIQPVTLLRTSPRGYMIDMLAGGGGHHRCVAHYLAGKPMVSLVEQAFSIDEGSERRIRDIIVDDCYDILEAKLKTGIITVENGRIKHV